MDTYSWDTPINMMRKIKIHSKLSVLVVKNKIGLLSVQLKV